MVTEQPEVDSFTQFVVANESSSARLMAACGGADRCITPSARVMALLSRRLLCEVQ